MPLPLATFEALAARCAPMVALGTQAALARAESGFEPYAIGVNGQRPRRFIETSASAAVARAESLIAEGANLDLGLMQVNLATVKRAGVSLEDAFDPCTNLRIAGMVLAADYVSAKASGRAPQLALRVAFSLYNTGRAERGFWSGYVARVTGDPLPPAGLSVAKSTPNPAPPWSVFGAHACAAFTIAPRAQGGLP